jgi:hypothetical protein
MEHSPFSEFDTHSANQNIFQLLQKTDEGKHRERYRGGKDIDL